MTMSVKFQGAPVSLAGVKLMLGESAPMFTLTDGDLNDVTLDTYHGKRKVLSIFPSIDTPVCATVVHTFNQFAAALDNTVVLCISADLPFAQARFCGAQGLENVVMLSSFRQGIFGEDYGVAITSLPLKGLLTRAVIVLDEHNRVMACEYVNEITQEPDYTAIITVLVSAHS